MEHFSILELLEVFEDSKYIFLVTEILDGRPFFDKIATMTSFSENDAAIILKQILTAVAYSHANDVAFEDLSPDRIRFEGEGKDCSALKIIEMPMGSAIEIDNKRELNMESSSCYVAPEVKKRNEKVMQDEVDVVTIVDSKPIDPRCDVWSIGVLMYVMLSG